MTSADDNAFIQSFCDELNNKENYNPNNPNAKATNSIYKKLNKETYSNYDLPIKKLDDYNLTDVDLIKIDTQGSEYDILLGGKQTLINNDAVLNVEIEHKNEGHRKRAREIIDFLSSVDYKEYGRSRRKEVVFKKERKA